MPATPWGNRWSVPTARRHAPRSITAEKISSTSSFLFLSPGSTNVPSAILSQNRTDDILCHRDIHRGGQNDHIGHIGGGLGGGLLETHTGRRPAGHRQP